MPRQGSCAGADIAGGDLHGAHLRPVENIDNAFVKRDALQHQWVKLGEIAGGRFVKRRRQPLVLGEGGAQIHLTAQTQRLDDFLRHQFTEVATKTAHDALGDPTDRQTVVASSGARWEDGFQFGHFADGQVQVRPYLAGGFTFDFDGLWDAGQVVERLVDGDRRLPGGGKLGPVLGDRLLVINESTLG